MRWFNETWQRSQWSLAVVCACVGALACENDPFNSPEIATVVLDPGLNAFMIVSGANAAVGSTVWIEGKVRVVDENVTPTAFVAELRYDPERLVPVEAESLNDGVLRVANLNAGPGRLKVAGAAASGLDTDTLFRIHLEVRGDGYLEGLGLTLGELDVVENNFADVTAQVRTNQTPVTPQTAVIERRY